MVKKKPIVQDAAQRVRLHSSKGKKSDRGEGIYYSEKKVLVGL